MTDAVIRRNGRNDMRSTAQVPQAARLDSGGLEARAMDVIWDRGGWSTVSEVHRLLAARPVTDSTAMTILVRLWRRGRLQHQRDGRAYICRSVRSREEHAASGTVALLAKVKDRPAALAHLLQTLSPADRDQVRRILLGLGPEEAGPTSRHRTSHPDSRLAPGVGELRPRRP